MPRASDINTNSHKGTHVGFAAPAEEELADTVTVGEYLINHKESTYMLEMVGDSMESEGIFSGDKILFERKGDAKVGDIVVELTDEGYQLRRFKKGKRVEMIGVVTASFRVYK